MKKCLECNVWVNTNAIRCPLCGVGLNQLGQSDITPLYPSYSKGRHGKRKINFLAKLFVFISIAASLICLFVNALTWNGLPWSLVVVGGIIVSWLLVGLPLLKTMNLNFMLIDQMIGVQIYLFLIDRIFGNKGWSLNYVYPLLYVAVAIVIVLFVIIYRIAWHDYLITAVLMAAIGFYPLILIAFGNIDVLWPSYTAMMFAVLLICGLYIFGRDKLKKEIRKRMNL